MITYNEMIPYMEYSDYDQHFWNAMRGKNEFYDRISKGHVLGHGTYAMAPVSNTKCMAALKKEGVFRQIATVKNAFNSGNRIWTKVCDDLAAWVPEGGEIPLYDGLKNFTRKNVDSFKLAVFVKSDLDFVRDAGFDFEEYLIHSLAQNFGRAEDNAFINGTGVNMPTGILAENGGAEIGVTTEALTYDDVVKLFLSVQPKYRRKAFWLMNDETALALRTIVDTNGNSIWNSNGNTVFGKKVIISEFMPNMTAGSKAIAFGDFRQYWVIARSPISIRSLTEAFVELDQIGHLAIEFMDGKLIHTDAVKVMQITDTAA